MILRINYSKYASWFSVRYVPHLASYVADMVSKRLPLLQQDIEALKLNHPEYSIVPTKPIKTARGYECTVVFNSKPLTFEASHA